MRCETVSDSTSLGISEADTRGRVQYLLQDQVGDEGRYLPTQYSVYFSVCFGAICWLSRLSMAYSISVDG
jgi:hypothetical protein